MSEASDAPETPGIQAKVIIDPSHPEAGRGGVVPPVHSRFQEGVSGNPSGKPRGSHDTRAGIRRRLARGWETDTEAESDDEKLGIEARALADQAVRLAMAGDAEGVRAICQVIAEAQGKPQEHVVTEQKAERVVVVYKAVPGDNPEELPPGVE